MKLLEPLGRLLGLFGLLLVPLALLGAPPGSLLCLAERGLDSVVFIVERLGPLFAHFHEVPAADYANQPRIIDVFFGIPGFT